MKARSILLSSLALAVGAGIGAAHASDQTTFTSQDLTENASVGAKLGTGDLGLNDNATLLSLNYNKHFGTYQGDTPYFQGGQFGVEAQTSFSIADAESSYTTSFGTSATQELDYFSLGVYGTHDRHIGHIIDVEGLNFTTKLGVDYTSRELNTQVGTSSSTTDDTSFTLAYGLGLNYSLSQDYQVSGEFQSNGDIDMFQAGVSYNF